MNEKPTAGGATPEYSAFADVTSIDGYHAHIYYEAQSRRSAERLRERLAERFRRYKSGRGTTNWWVRTPSRCFV